MLNTSAWKVQAPFAGTVALVSAMLVPATAAATAPPAQVVEALGGLATDKPDGRLSVRATPFRVCVFALVMTTVSVETCPALTGAGLNALVMTGGSSTFRVATASFGFLKPSSEVTVSLGMVLV